MGVIVKQSLWSTVIAYTGLVIGYFNTLYLRPVYFEIDQIGIFQLITSNAMILSPLISLGLHSSFIRFFPSFEKTDQNHFFTFLLLISSLSIIIVFAGIGLLHNSIESYYREKAPEYIQFIGITGIVVVANGLFELFYSFSRSRLEVFIPSIIRDIYLRLGMIFLVAGFGFNLFSFTTAAYGIGVLYVSGLLAFTIILFFKSGLRLVFNFRFISYTWLKSLLSYSLFAMFSAISFAMINHISFSQITSALGPRMNGIFSTCFFLGLIVELPRQNMSRIVQPILSKASESKNEAQIHAIYHKSAITMGAIGLLITIGIITNLEDLFVYIPKGNEFQQGYWVVVAVCTARLAIMISGFPEMIITYSKKYRVHLYLQIMAAAMIFGLNHLLIPLHGINGVALSYLITMLMLTLARIIYVYLYFSRHPFDKKHLMLLSIGFLVAVIALSINFGLHPLPQIFLRSVVSVVIFVFLIYRFKISEDINRLIRSTFDRLNIKLNTK